MVFFQVDLIFDRKMKMSQLQFKDQLTLIEENLDRYLKSKKTDCILYAEDGSKFKIHKEVLGQTYFLRKILFSAKEHCCQIMEILLPCSKNELSHLVNFLYDGEIRCKDEKDSLKILENLNKLFGFDESLDFRNNYEEPFQADESFCSSTDTEVLGDKEEALDNVVVIPIVNSINPIQRLRKVQKSGGAKKRLFIENDVAQTKSIPEKHNERAESNKNLSTKNVHDFVEEPIVKSINPIQRRRKVQKSGWAKKRLFVENEIGSATVSGDKTQVRKITPFSKDSAEYLKWKKARTQTKSIPEKPNERAEKNTNISTKNVYDFVEEPIVKSINTIQSWRKFQKSGGAKRRLFEGNNAASTTVSGAKYLFFVSSCSVKILKKYKNQVLSPRELSFLSFEESVFIFQFLNIKMYNYANKT